MTFKVQRGTFAKSTAGAPVSQTIDTGTGLDIKYIHFWTEQQVGTGFSAESQGHTEGWSNVTNEVSVGGAAEHDANPTNTSRRMAELALSCIAPTGAVNFEGTVTSFGTGIDAGKFTVNWTTNNASAVQIYYEVYCGDKILNVDIGVITPNVLTGNQAITGIGFQPNYLQYCSIGDGTALPNTQDDNMVGVGSAVSNTKRNTEAYYMNDDGTDTITTQTDLLLRTLEITGGMGGGAEVQVDIDFVSFDADGWTHNVVDGNLEQPLIGYCAVEFDPLIDIDIGVFSQPTSASTVNTTTSNKNIQAVFFRSQNRTVIGTIIDDGHVRITTGIGVLLPFLSPSDEQVTGFDYDDAAVPTDSENMGVTDKAIKFFEQLSTTLAEANLIDSTVATDFRLDWTTADAVARSILYTAYSFQAETKTLTHTTDSILKAIQTDTHTTDSFLKAIQMDTHTTDSILKDTKTLTHTTDSFIARAIYKTHTTDSLLLAIFFQQHTTDSALREIDIELFHTTDSIVREIDIEIAHTTDSYLKAIEELIHTTDSFIIRRFESDHTTDSVLGEREPGFTIAHTTDSTLKKLDIEITHTTDSILREIDTEITHTTDSYLLGKTELAHTTDSILKKLDIEITHTTDSVLGETEPGLTVVHTTDSTIKKLDIEITHTTDSVLGETEPGVPVTHTTDSYLTKLEIRTNTHTTDSTLQGPIEIVHTTDSVLLVIKELEHTTDSILLAITPLEHTTDSILLAKVEIEHTTDSYLKAIRILFHTTDSVLGETEPGLSVTHTTDTNLINRNQCHLLTEAGGHLLQEGEGRLLLEVCKHVLPHTTDSLIGPIGFKTHTTDSFIRDRFQSDTEIYVDYDDTPEISIYFNEIEEISVIG